MDELINRIAANIGIDRAVAERSVGIILDFLSSEGPADKVGPMLAQLPGAATLIENSRAGGGYTGGGVMAVGGRLMAAGLGFGEIQGVTREIIGYAREKAGEDAGGEILGAIPGLGQFI